MVKGFAGFGLLRPPALSRLRLRVWQANDVGVILACEATDLANGQPIKGGLSYLFVEAGGAAVFDVVTLVGCFVEDPDRSEVDCGRAQDRADVGGGRAEQGSGLGDDRGDAGE
jgi:hypothetical protein